MWSFDLWCFQHAPSTLSPRNRLSLIGLPCSRNKGNLKILKNSYIIMLSENFESFQRILSINYITFLIEFPSDFKYFRHKLYNVIWVRNRCRIDKPIFSLRTSHFVFLNSEAKMGFPVFVLRFFVFSSEFKNKKFKNTHFEILVF